MSNQWMLVVHGSTFRPEICSKSIPHENGGINNIQTQKVRSLHLPLSIHSKKYCGAFIWGKITMHILGLHMNFNY